MVLINVYYLRGTVVDAGYVTGTSLQSSADSGQRQE